tara:strand:- start:213 stop:491 length:279 start_codon:yes stop_codon:yes gene_type:complete
MSHVIVLCICIYIIYYLAGECSSMLNFSLRGNLDCNYICANLDKYIKKYMKENPNKNIQDHIVHIQIKPLQEGKLVKDTQKRLALDFEIQES